MMLATPKMVHQQCTQKAVTLSLHACICSLQGCHHGRKPASACAWAPCGPPMRLHLPTCELMPCITVASHAGRALTRLVYAATDGHFSKSNYTAWKKLVKRFLTRERALHVGLADALYVRLVCPQMAICSRLPASANVRFP